MQQTLTNDVLWDWDNLPLKWASISLPSSKAEIKFGKKDLLSPFIKVTWGGREIDSDIVPQLDFLFFQKKSRNWAMLAEIQFNSKATYHLIWPMLKNIKWRTIISWELSSLPAVNIWILQNVCSCSTEATRDLGKVPVLQDWSLF